MKPRPPIPEGPYLVVGLARSGLAAARLLSERGHQVVGVDAAEPRGASEELAELRARGVALHVHSDGVAQLADVRAVVKSPGVPAQAPAIAVARARGLPVLGELELAWRLLANELVAVTGTNGKTTTVEWIAHIHRAAALPVVAAGNVGVALSGLAGQLAERTTVVCEASSFQLEDTLAFAPEAAVLLNIAPDHLDRHGTLEHYRAAKLRIFANQGAGDLAVLPFEIDAPGRSEDVGTLAGTPVSAVVPSQVALVRFGADARAQCAVHEGILRWQGEPLLRVEDLRLRGAHNVRNALAAAAACLALGVDIDAVRAGLRGFPGVPHRLQEVARREGVVYVNDSKATNVASTLVALQAFPEGGVHLILGGQGKGQDFAPLREAVAATCRAAYLIGEDAPQIAAALEGIEVPLHDCRELERAVAAARAAAVSGEVVLLSPACASFDQFADFEDRGERFAELVSGS